MMHISLHGGPAAHPQPAVAWSGRMQDHTTALIGIPLRIALIVGALLLVRTVAKKAITRVVRHILGARRTARPSGARRGCPAPARLCSPVTGPERSSAANSGPAPSVPYSATP
jgi:hypothetical protein